MAKPQSDKLPVQLEWTRVSVAEARKLIEDHNVMIWWRPNTRLKEQDQYCLIIKYKE